MKKIMNNKTKSSFQKMIDVNTPIIYINDYDFVRVDELISKVIGNKKVYEWNPATGTTDFKWKVAKGQGTGQTLDSFLYDQYTFEPDSEPQEKFLVLKEIQDYLDDPKIKTLLELMSQRKLYDRKYETTIIIVSTVLKVPVEIEKYVSFLDMQFPDADEIKELIKQHVEANHYSTFKEEDRDKLMPSFKGMTCFEIDRMLDMAMSSNGSLSVEDKEMILMQKKQVVRKSGVLELVDSMENIDSIGGMEVLKKYLKSKSNIVKNLSEAMKFGVTTPKGVFIVGMPGCGKSLCAKASAALFEAPLLKMDMGSLMGKYVGESEANLRKAIKIAEAAAPCVLWIDEIEKAFSGVGGNNDVLTRMFGYFLSWMQDKDSSVYVIATANNADKLPPELKRKGRFDEIFCVNLPNPDERKAIFKVHLEKKKKKGCPISGEIDSIITEDLLTATNGFNGADIESVVNESVEKCFLDGKKELTTETLVEIANSTKSISKTCEDQIKTMNKLFANKAFTDASK